VVANTKEEPKRLPTNKEVLINFVIPIGVKDSS